ncbi:hypothetical protein ABC977_16740 [Thioalkalicoccus limnaeus]|uniref:Uncharacterized protein n=1 Tax=Thioalkalicoccus limnaeus TaxID=120681 RepID=A0ABV4BHR3_9GAMM
MLERPKIRTAIPKRRYQIGDYAATLLGEIESEDSHRYRFILAWVRHGDVQPCLYVVSDEAPEQSDSNGTPFRLVVVNDVLTEVFDTDERWGDLEVFADQALRLGTQYLGLQREAQVRLL